MIIRNGEVRKIGIEVINQLGQTFVVETADYTIDDVNGNTIDSGVAVINGPKITAMFSAQTVGKYYCRFTYRIVNEIIKAEIYVEVI